MAKLAKPPTQPSLAGDACHSFRLRCPARDANAIVVAPSMQ